MFVDVVQYIFLSKPNKKSRTKTLLILNNLDNRPVCCREARLNVAIFFVYLLLFFTKDIFRLSALQLEPLPPAIQ